MVGGLSGAALGAFSGFQFGGPWGAALGAGIGGVAGTFNDFVYRPGQPPIAFSSDDTLIGVKDTTTLGGNTSALESKIDKLIMVSEEQYRLFRNGLYVEMRDFDKALIKHQEATIRNF